MIVSAVRADDYGPVSGAAYIYRHSDSIWVEEAKLLASDGVLGDGFGASVAISNDVAIIGSILDDDACQGDPLCNSGSAYIFRNTGSVWIEEAKLLASDGDDDDQFGRTVAINGGVAVVGSLALGDGIPGPAVYVFEGLGAPAIPGDLDGDGIVNTTDLLILFANWGLCGDCNNCPADLNGDCTVNTSDLLILFANWG